MKLVLQKPREGSPAPRRRPRSISARRSLSGWPSVTDSEVKRNPLSMVILCVGSRVLHGRARTGRCRASHHSDTACAGRPRVRITAHSQGLIAGAAGLHVFQAADAAGDEVGVSTAAFVDAPRPSEDGQAYCLMSLRSSRPCRRTRGPAGPGLRAASGGEQEVVVPFPGRPGVPVAVADVQRPADRHAVGHDVDRLDGEGGLFRVVEAGNGCRSGRMAASAWRPRLGVEPGGQRADQVGGLAVGAVGVLPRRRTDGAPARVKVNFTW